MEKGELKSTVVFLFRETGVGGGAAQMGRA